MVNVPERSDPRVQKDPTLSIVMCLLGIGLVCTAAALAASDPPEIRGLESEASIMTYVDIAGFILVETFLVGMAIVLLSACIRAFSTRVTERGVSQLRPLLLRRVSIPYEEVAALREKGGRLWVESSQEAIILAFPFSHRDPEGLVAFLKEHVPPGTRYIPEN